ncbi:MAG: flagellar filament capping protein FliD [Myxococcota bacterium]
MDYHATKSVFNSDLGIKGPLTSESTTRRAMEDLSTTLTKQFSVSGTSFDALVGFGVKTLSDGKIELDAEKFKASLDGDPSGAVSFLTDAGGPLNTLADRIDSLYVDSDNGSLVTRDEGLASSIDDMNEQIGKAEERLAIHAEILRNQFTAMEVALSRLSTSQSFITSLVNSSMKSSSSK